MTQWLEKIRNLIFFMDSLKGGGSLTQVFAGKYQLFYSCMADYLLSSFFFILQIVTDAATTFQKVKYDT